MCNGTIDLLADRLELVDAVGVMRWQEWGRFPEPADPEWWVEATRREVGRDGLPVTYVATGENGALIGAVGLGEFDVEERQDQPPWILGLVVRPHCRRTGIGRRLLSRVEQHAAELGYRAMWVANEGEAVGFYRRCGYQFVESVRRGRGGTTHIFTRSLELDS